MRYALRCSGPVLLGRVPKGSRKGTRRRAWCPLTALSAARVPSPQGTRTIFTPSIPADGSGRWHRFGSAAGTFLVSLPRQHAETRLTIQPSSSSSPDSSEHSAALWGRSADSRCFPNENLLQTALLYFPTESKPKGRAGDAKSPAAGAGMRAEPPAAFCRAVPVQHHVPNGVGLGSLLS